MCYKCVTKNHFYLFLNTYRHFLFLCSSIISTCLLCFSYSACNSALRKAIYSTVKPMLIEFIHTVSVCPGFHNIKFFNNSRFALPIRNRRNLFSFVCLTRSMVMPCSLATAAIVRLFMNISLIILFSLSLVKRSTMPHNSLLECSAYNFIYRFIFKAKIGLYGIGKCQAVIIR